MSTWRNSSSSSLPNAASCHPTILSSVIPFCPQSFPASGSFPVSWLLASGGQSIGASASRSVLPMNIQGWFPLGLIGLISLLSSGLSRVFSRTTFQKHQYFGNRPSLWSNCSSAGKESAWNAGDPSLILGSGRSTGEGNGNPFEYSCLGNSMDGGA